MKVVQQEINTLIIQTLRMIMTIKMILIVMRPQKMNMKISTMK